MRVKRDIRLQTQPSVRMELCRIAKIFKSVIEKIKINKRIQPPNFPRIKRSISAMLLGLESIFQFEADGIFLINRINFVKRLKPCMGHRGCWKIIVADTRLKNMTDLVVIQAPRVDK